MHDAQHQDDMILIDDVVHHAVVADPNSVKRVAHALDRLDRLSADATGLGSVAR